MNRFVFKMATSSEKVEKLAKQLTTRITGFEAGDDNYHICMQYVMSNLKYHKFLDPDSCKISRSVEGLLTKFKIHCEDEKARHLEKYVKEFLELPAFEMRESGKTNTHWAVLSLLLHLSDSPLRRKYIPSEKVVKKEKEDNFDWYSYLMEGEEPYIPPLDESSDGDSEAELEEVSKPNVTFAADVSHAIITEATEEKPRKDVLAWLEKHVVVQYWKHGQAVQPSPHDSSSFNLQWEERLSQSVDIYVSEKCVQVTEYQVVREAIWLLYGTEQSFIFMQDNGVWKVRPNVQLTHITHSALSASLGSIIRCSSIIRKIQNFLQYNPSQGEQIPQTYQAFRGALSDFSVQFQQYLADVEKTILKRESTVTVTFLLKTLSSRLGDFDAIEHILIHGIEACQDIQDNAVKACSLLATMYHLLTSCHVLADSSTQINIVLPLWIKSCKPYLDKIDKWLYEGILYDPLLEFIIRINEDVGEEEYWDKGFTLHCTASGESEGSEEDTQFAPIFLLPVLHRVIMAGKSMHLLQKLGKVSQIYPGASRQTLYEAFVASIAEYLGCEPPNIDHEESTVSVNVPALVGKTEDQIKDPLLMLNFEQITQRSVLGQDLSHTTELLNISDEHLKPMCPIQLMLRHCLYAHVTQRYEVVCSYLLNVMKNEYGLYDQFAAIKRYFLMAAGDVMYDFSTELFEKLRHREEWRDVSYLNVMMQECIHARFPQDEDRITVDVETRRRGDRTPIAALDQLALYFKMPWPVTAIINKKCMNIYNTVFRFALMIKRAKYCLDGLRFTELETAGMYEALNQTADDSILETSTIVPDRAQLIHSMHILRFKLQTFANNIHDYIMTRIVHGASIKFEESLEKARDIDDVIKAHNNYVTTLHARSLEHREVKLIKQIVVKLLNMSLKFCTMWDQGIQNIKYKQICDMEGEYSRSAQFLSTFFKKVMSRGSFEHLEPLAFALESMHVQKAALKT